MTLCRLSPRILLLLCWSISCFVAGFPDQAQTCGRLFKEDTGIFALDEMITVAHGHELTEGQEYCLPAPVTVHLGAPSTAGSVHFRGTLRFRPAPGACDPDQFNRRPATAATAQERLLALGSNEAATPLLGRFLFPSTAALTSTSAMGWLTDTVLYVIDNSGPGHVMLYDTSKNFSLFMSAQMHRATALHPPIVQSNMWNGGYGALIILPRDCAVGELTVSAENAAVGNIPSGTFFGQDFYYLSNGDLLITYMAYKGDSGTLTNAGLVRHCRAEAGACRGVSNSSNSLVGGVSGSRIGWHSGAPGVNELPDGSYLLRSPQYYADASSVAGAVTWPAHVHTPEPPLYDTHVPTAGASGVGTHVRVLADGTYVVSSPTWYSNRGFVAVGNSTHPVAGVVSAANSLVGASAGDKLGNLEENLMFIWNPNIHFLENGTFVAITGALGTFNYLPATQTFVITGSANQFSNGYAHSYSGTTGAGCIGNIANVAQLLGTATQPLVPRVLVLTNGNYVVSGAAWNDPAHSRTAVGFAMLCTGAAGCPSSISSATALVGGATNARVSQQGVLALSDGGYVTYCPASGCQGVLSATNSLVGLGLAVSFTTFTLLATPEGGFVVGCSACTRSGLLNAGIVARCGPGGAGCLGQTASPANSLSGDAENTKMGLFLALSHNGSLIIAAPGYASTKGAVFWYPATELVVGQPDPAMGLVGATGQSVGDGALMVTPNEDYIVWSKTGMLLTWCSGVTGCRGVTVTEADTITGIPTSTDPALKIRQGGDGDYYLLMGAELLVWGPKDRAFPTGPLGPTTALVGIQGSATTLINLPNGAFLVACFLSLSSAGSITWCSGTDPCVGTVSAARSLVGASAGDRLGNLGTAFTTAVTLGPGSPQPLHYLVRWTSTSTTASSMTICPTASGCAGVVTDPAVSLVGTSTMRFKGTIDFVPEADLIRFLPNGNIIFHILGAPVATTQGKTYTLCVPSAGCNGTLSAANTFGGNPGTILAMPPAGSPEYAASSFYAGRGDLRLNNTASFTAANSALGDATHPKLGYRDLFMGPNGFWVGHDNPAGLSYLALVNGQLPLGTAVTADNYIAGDSAAMQVDAATGILVDSGSTRSVQVGLTQRYHSHFEQVAAETDGERVVMRFWVDEPVQMVGWTATMKVTHPDYQFSVTQNLVFDQTGRASVESCSSCSFEAGVYPLGKKYPARISLLAPAVFFDNLVWDTLLDFEVPTEPAFDPVTPFTPANCYAGVSEPCEVHIKAKRYSLPAQVTLDGQPCQVLGDSTTSDLHVRLPPQFQAGTFILELTSSDGLKVSTSFAYLGTTPEIYSAGPSCPPEGCTITITGTGFYNPTVSYGSSGPLYCPTWNGTVISCQMPEAESESGTLYLENGNHRQTGISYSYRFVYPTIDSVDPEQVEAAGGDITIRGHDFIDPTVTMEGRPCPVQSATPTVIVCTAPPAPKEHCRLTVQISAPGQHSDTITYTYNLRRPVIASVGPACSLLGGCVITITGSDFDTPTVTLASAPLTCTAATATEVNCTVPAGTAEHANLTLINLGGYADSVTYTYQVHTPVLSGCTPASCPAATGCLLALSGSAFELPAVTLGGTLACTLVSAESTLILAQCGPSALHGPQNLTVTNAGGRQASRIITVQGAAPTFASVTPSAGPALMVAPASLTIAGAGFWADPASGSCPTQPLGAADLVVTNPDGVSGTLMGAYTFQGAWPSLTVVSPATGPLAGGQLVTVVGTGLRAGVLVTLGGAACTGVALGSGSSSLTCTTPAGAAAGLVDVTLTNSDLTSATLAAAYAYQGAVPTLGQVWPVSGPTSGATGLTLSGTGFRAGATVLLGSLPCTGLVVHNQTAITCTSPPGAEAKVNVTVANADLTSATLPQAFEFTPLAGTRLISSPPYLFRRSAAAVGSPVYPPVFISISPATCRATSSLTVTLICSNYHCFVVVVSTVFFFILEAATWPLLAMMGGHETMIRITRTRVRCVVPAGGTVGSADVTVRNTDGLTTTAVGAFTFTGPAPAVGGVSPSTLAAASGPTTITVTGSDFRPGCTVRVGSLPCTGIVIAADGNSLQCTVNPTAAATATTAATGRNDVAVAIGPADVVVTNADGTMAVMPLPFYFQAEAPTLSGVSPRRGFFKAATRVTLTGTHLRANATVLVGGRACLEVEVLTGETVRAYVPPPPEGTPTGADWVTDVQLLNYDMTSATLGDAFTYVAATATAEGDDLAGGVSGGSVALFVVGALMLVGGLLAVLAVFLARRRRRRSADSARHSSPISLGVSGSHPIICFPIPHGGAASATVLPPSAAGSLAEAGQGQQGHQGSLAETPNDSKGGDLEMVQMNPMMAMPAATPPPPPPPATTIIVLTAPPASASVAVVPSETAAYVPAPVVAAALPAVAVTDNDGVPAAARV
ncbi:putative Light-harvesting LHII; alpha subunit B / Histone protein [Paratrimastix pyriformis]|uniref:Light-harvesting LHII n=1 Tax=Paratrimastix pyriformis TaxID=342808 RepID=A0ABQ8UFE6_9EUKA|nr:putative Light-harvesting LHII; alpha subunit B / Histone protein [Paratrimastix pyriformis]